MTHLHTSHLSHRSPIAAALTAISLLGCAGGDGAEDPQASPAAALDQTDPSATQDAAGMGAMTGMDMSTMTGMGPQANDALIPAGDPGIDYLAVRPSKDTPEPDPGGIGAFRTECAYSHMLRDDPLLFPGKPGASHLHAFFGNTMADANSTPETLRTSGNSTCRGGLANRTAYWVPAIVDTTNGAPVKPFRGAMYYKTGYGGVKYQDVRPFPEGLRMIAGDAKSTAAQEHAWWGCAEFYLGHLASIPECGEGNHVIMTVTFPQCWNGKDADSPDHRSHMAYPMEDGSGCPATHPVAIPEISFNIFYENPASGTANWRLASDMYDPSMPAGMSAHADWMDAWMPDIVNTWVNDCDDKGLDCSSHMLGDGREIYYTDTL